MLKSLKNKLGDRFVQLWLLLFVLIVVVLLIQQNQQAPTLEQVLTTHRYNSAANLSVFISSLLAFSLAAMSIAKGYEIVQRTRTVRPIVLPENPECESCDVLESEIDIKNREINELIEHNGQLKNTVERLVAEIEGFKVAEMMLRKSNVSLGKECERLKFENEAMLAPKVLKVTRKKTK